jgi:hypothetical protein
MAVASGKVERVERMFAAGVAANKGILGLIQMFDQANAAVWRTRTYTEEDEHRGLLLLRLGGARVAGIAQKALGLPSISHLRQIALIPILVPSPSEPKLKEVEKNVLACFESIKGETERHTIVHQVLMIDELKVEECPRWDDKSNMIIGICREHSKLASLEYTSENEAKVVVQDVVDGKLQAVEASV